MTRPGGWGPLKPVVDGTEHQTILGTDPDVNSLAVAARARFGW